jgi:hypothetical protein
MLVGAGNELASKQLFHAPRTHQPVSFRSPAKHTKQVKQGKHAKAKQK